MKKIVSFLVVPGLLLAGACAQPPVIENNPLPLTSPIEPSNTPIPTHQPTQTRARPAISSPTEIAIPSELMEQLHTFWEIMVFIQWHSGLVAEAADRVQSGELEMEEAEVIVRDNDFTTEQLDGSIELLAKKQITVPEAFSAEWAELLKAHSTTTGIFSRWIDQEIEAQQVIAEMQPVQKTVEAELVSAEAKIARMIGLHETELTQIRLRNIPPRIVSVFEPQATEPTQVVEACAGEALMEAEVSRSGRIAFVSTRDGNAEIYVMNADGTGVTRLTDNTAGDYNPAWSPDGKRIAFYSQRDGNAEIYVMNADGSDLTRLTEHPKDDFDPTWSSDGKSIAFHSHRLGENPLIFVMKADGTGVGNLSPMGVVDWSPDWSPVENKIVFNSGRSGGNRDIWLMNANGTAPVNLTSHSADDWWPAWSPDGKQIVFHSDRTGNFDVYIMSIQDKKTTQLTDDSGQEYGADWSADGTRIAYTSDRSGNREICVKNASGKGVYNLTNHPAHDWAAVWMP